MVKAVPTSVRIATFLFVVLTLVFVLAPLVVVAGVSVSESQFIAFPPNGFSLRWYSAILTSGAYLGAAWTSLKLAVLVTLCATVIGAGAAITLHRRRLPGTVLLAGLFLSPLILPTIIFAIGLLMLWSATFGPVSFTALWIGHTVVALPYVVRTTLAVLAESDPFLEEAAATMGARRWQRLLYVVLPQCLPGLAAGAFFAFNISFDEAVVALFLRTPDLVTLPIQIYNQLEFSPDPSVAAVSTLMIGVTILLILVIDRLLGIQRFTGA
ncbi:ABC transporter permease [Chelatococcus asaccharovorans]|uniref:Putative spermidine/putrescine transport system permease protein n=1 Tax=Chelatococcus asaccharovorans TaxID=28210 RepID=A0A2V3UDU4_9HYPH|nr:ABC transporter permease [Chelatococcus asaccharovorans]MBS7702180.1 ABC transporter permease [Chelatococcus asaccharovorans]PXW56622.1 putative spermidine/putrescine transport system permease protein [Chelatococcus asaccharovorans]CAH1668457.1 putative spermidine/putrescine transport system permease protein [Chelatococcus asaccharovorans]CAH1680071.1 putative spermidine/putrescine transport system permease protein [Chelatococcus asaccharovorans]